MRDRALAAESDLIARYDAALALPSVTADAALSARLTAIRTEHSSHAAAIGAGYTPPPSTPGPSTPPTTEAPTPPPASGTVDTNTPVSGTVDTNTPVSGTVDTNTPVPPPTAPPIDAKTAVVTLAKAEQDAASARTADILSTDGATAMLLASVAAAEAGHAALLLGGTA